MVLMQAAPDAANAVEETRLRQAWARRWRVRAVAAATLAWMLLSPQSAWARTVKRVASREEEMRAALITAGVIALLFVAAYFNSKKEDSSEDARIKGEVERLVRLKKEFEEAENSEATDDDMAASLRVAKQKLAADAKESGEVDAEAGKAKGEEGDASKEDKEDKDGKDGEDKGDKGKPKPKPPKPE